MIELFNNLEGAWKLYRTFSQSGDMHGKVTFKKLGNEPLYHYQEEGTMTIAGRSYKAYKSYNYSYADDKLIIHSWDEHVQQKAGLLHVLEFPAYKDNKWPLNSYSTYNCSQDVYKLHFVFNNPTHFEINYQILGPRKNYSIHTKIFRD